MHWFLCWFVPIKDQHLKPAFSLPCTIILNYTFTYNFGFPSFSSFSVIHPQNNYFATLCKIQRAKLCSQVAHPQTTSLWSYYNFPSQCLFIFSLAGILNFSTRHIGTIIFTLFYASCWACLPAHSQTSASSAADNLPSSVGLVYYSVPKGHNVLWVALVESCWIFLLRGKKNCEQKQGWICFHLIDWKKSTFSNKGPIYSILL